MDSGAGDEDSDPVDWGGDWDWEDEAEAAAWRTLEPLAGIPNLAGLEVARSMRLPPDWRTLSTLQRLSVKSGREVEWGAAPTALTALTSLRLHASALRGRCQYPASLCALPALRSLTIGLLLGSMIRVDNSPVTLPVGFTKLTALTRLELKHLSLAQSSAAMLAKKLPNLEVVRRGFGAAAAAAAGGSDEEGSDE